MEVHYLAIQSGDRDEMKLKDAVRDAGTLEYIAEKADRIRKEIDRAAFLLYSVANYHPFVEGNKRTAIILAEFTLKRYILKGDVNENNAAICSIASGQMTESEVKEWIKRTFVRLTQ